VGGSKQVSRALGGCALAVVAFAVPAHGAEVNVVGDVVEQAAQSLPPVQLPLPAPPPTPASPAPGAAPANPAPVAPAPAAPPSAPAPPAAPAASTTVQPKAARAAGSRAAARGARDRPATAAASAERGDRGRRAHDAGAVAVAAQVGGAPSETADPEATGAQPAGDPDGALPFTGFQALVVALLGLLALGAGFELRRATRRQPRTSRAGA
jgi:hypothetical protein